MASRQVLYLIDGHSLAYRHHFAYINNPLMTSAGEPTSAIFGFSRNLMDILAKDRPHYLAVTFDDGLSGRDELYGEYKGTRDQMPDDLTRQMPHIMRVVKAFNMPILMLKGYEADDVIGTVSKQAVEQGLDVRIVSGDGDILQLLDPQTTVALRVRRKGDNGKFSVYDIIYNEDVFEQEYFLKPPQLVDYKALKGDTSDNIPGVPGIGDKTATTLIQEYGTLENLYENVALIKGATQKKLIEGRESAFLSKNLATIRRNVPIEIDIRQCVAHDFNKADVEALYNEFEFHGHIRQLNKLVTSPDSEQLTLFAPDAAPARPIEELVETIIVRDQAALDALIETLNAAEMIAFDTETTSTDQMAAELVGISLSVNGEQGYYIPVGHEAGEQLELEQVTQALRPPMTNPAIQKSAHNATYDLVVFQRYGIDVAPITFDTMVAEWLRDPGSNHLGLKNLAANRLGAPMTHIEELIGSGKKQITMDKVAIEQAAPYAAADAAFTYQLIAPLRAALDDDLTRLNDTIEMPLVPVIAAIEEAGILLDVPFLADLSVKLNLRLQALAVEIYELGGMGPFNINSPKQLNDVLFGALNLKAEGLRKTSHGFSTAADVLENMRGEHPIIDGILQYREISKLKGTYVDALPALINARTGRLHTSYNQAGSATGRMSSSNPNLQNIPTRTEAGREVRRAIITPPGTCLLAVDYSQVELRVMAHVADEPYLLDAFNQGQDIHAATAAVLYNVPIETVNKNQRDFAKRINFGLLYGMGPFRLARDSELTLAEARAFIQTYFQRLPNVERYLESTKAMARDEGYVQTLFGRKRRFPQLRDGGGNFNNVATAEREAINMPIQGTAADIIKKAMIDLYAELTRRKLASRMILQVHDELVLEVPEREIDEAAALVVEVMESAYTLKAPLKADAEIGTNWRDMEPVGRK